VKLIVDGELKGLWHANSLDVNEDDNKERVNRLGTPKKPNEKTTDGFSGTIEFDADGPELDEITDAQIEARRSRKNFKFQILERTYYPKRGTTKAYVYPGAIFSTDKSIGGQDEAVTSTMNWQSEVRREL